MYLIAFLSLLVVVGALMWLLSRACSRASPRVRYILRATSVFATVVTLLGAIASAQFPGPVSRYSEMSLAFYLRHSIIPVSGVTAFLIPLWFTLGVSSSGSQAFRFHPAMSISVGVAAAAFSIVGLALAIFVGCNHAGACF
jgi:hypothetical protein